MNLFSIDILAYLGNQPCLIMKQYQRTTKTFHIISLNTNRPMEIRVRVLGQTKKFGWIKPHYGTPKFSLLISMFMNTVESRCFESRMNRHIYIK